MTDCLLLNCVRKGVLQDDLYSLWHCPIDQVLNDADSSSEISQG